MWKSLPLTLGLAVPVVAAVVVVPPAHADQPTEPANGRRAIALLGNRIDRAAADNGLSADSLRALLVSDPTAWVDTDGRVFFIEPAAPAAFGKQAVAGAAPFPLDQTFQLHSRPGSSHVIFVDFDGATVSNSAWNDQEQVTSGQHPAWTLDGDATTFDSTERQAIQSIWLRVSEDFAPFDVDVTTQDPGQSAIERTSLADTQYGTRVLVSPSADAVNNICGGGCGGVAYIDVFDEVGGSYYQPAWVFPQKLGLDDTKNIAEAVSHEVGHNFGLRHDGTSVGVGCSSTAYYCGHAMWAPIMGVGYQKPVAQWSRGEYPSANNTENDLSIIASGGAPLLTDEAGGSVGTAAPGLPGAAYITSATDTDTFALGPCSGTVTVLATGAAPSQNLDLRLELLDAGGSPVTTADPVSAFVTRDSATGLDATVTADVAPGTYYVRVDGAGNGTGATGYSDYASIGAYTLAESGCNTQTAPAAPTNLVVTPDPAGTSATVSWSAPVWDGGSPVTGYQVANGGATASQTTLTKTWTGLTPGVGYVFSVSAKNSIGTGLAASQSVTMPVHASSAASVASTPTTPTAPTAPALRKAKSGKPGGKRTASIHWRRAGDGGLPVTRYRVVVLKAKSGKVVRTVTVTASATSYVAKLASGKYQFAVVAVNSVGAGARSARSKVVTAR